MAKIAGIFLAFFGFGKKSRKVSSKSRMSSERSPERIGTTNSTNCRRRSKTAIDISADNNCLSYQHTEKESPDILSMKTLNDSLVSGEYDAVPDAVNYRIPFASPESYEGKNVSQNTLARQDICLTQKLRKELGEEIKQEIEEKFREEFQEIRSEMKKHRKWY